MAVFFSQVFFLLGQVLSALGVVSNLVQRAAQEHISFNIETIVTSTALNVASPLFGLDAAYAQRVDIISRLTALQASVTAIPTGPQLAANPVILPTTPPTGYGADNTGAAAAVWSFVLGQGEDTGSALDDLYGSRISYIGNSFVTLPGFPWMVGYSLDAWQNLNDGNMLPPVALDSSTILPTDASILAWANRAHHGPLGWTNTGFRGVTVPMQLDQNTVNVKWIITMTHAQFLAFQAVASVPLLPPIWPGFAKVTLQAPVALAPGVSIISDMDGILIDITGVPTRTNFYSFDGAISYRNLGAVTFFDDNGDFEHAQTFSFESQLITPRTMKRAGGLKLRSVGGVSGTVRPWTINP